MLREAVQEDLFELLNLYLSLHEKEIPEDSLHLQQVWSEMISDQRHHVIVKEVEGRMVSSWYLCHYSQFDKRCETLCFDRKCGDSRRR